MKKKKQRGHYRQRGLQNKHGLPNIPIMFVRLTPKNARWNGKRFDGIFHTRKLEVGIEFSMNTCYHLDTSKQIKQKTLSSVEHASYPSCEERTGHVHLHG